MVAVQRQGAFHLDPNSALEALGREPPGNRPELYGDGHAAERCVEAIGAFAETAGART